MCQGKGQRGCTVVYDRGEQVIGPVQAGVDGEQEADQDLVGKHQRGLRHMEAVASKRRGRR